MKHRFVGFAVAALATAAGVTACAQEHISATRDAQVTINGITHKTPVTCDELYPYWTLTVGDQASGVESVNVLSGEKASPQWVKFRNFGGFTGSFWQGGVGSGAAMFSAGRFTITGSAYGVNADNPRPITTSFKIVADC